MPKQRHELKLLLLQIRDTQETCIEEHESFAKYSGLKSSQIDILNVFETPFFEPHVIDGYDALFVGGSSEASVLEPEKYPFLEDCKRLLHYCIEQEIPTFASCFGHQLAVIALGGEIIHDEKDFEMGVIPISLNENAKDDPIFRDTPDGFLAISVHRERTLEAPNGCIPLAFTSPCSHSFRVAGKPFWTAQFHPEVDRQVLVDRLTRYKARYTSGDDHLEKILANAVETPESNGLLKKFVDRVLLTGNGI